MFCINPLNYKIFKYDVFLFFMNFDIKSATERIKTERFMRSFGINYNTNNP